MTVVPRHREIVINIPLTCYARRVNLSPRGSFVVAVSVAAAAAAGSYRSRAPPYCNRGIAFAANLQRYRAHKRANIDLGSLLLCVPRGIQSRNRACLRKHARPLSLVSRRAPLPALHASRRIFGLLSRTLYAITARSNSSRFGSRSRNLRVWLDHDNHGDRPISIALIANISNFLVSSPRVGQGIKMASLRAFSEALKGRSRSRIMSAYTQTLLRL